MPTDKIYDVSFLGVFFFFPFPFCSNGVHRFSHQNKFLTYQMLVNPEQAYICADLCLCEICGQQRGKNDATEKKKNHIPMAPCRNTSSTLYYAFSVMRRN